MRLRGLLAGGTKLQGQHDGFVVVMLPVISQMSTWPSVFCHRMSVLPSPKKSPVPLICQDGPGFAASTSACTILLPFMSQSAT